MLNQLKAYKFNILLVVVSFFALLAFTLAMAPKEAEAVSCVGCPYTLSAVGLQCSTVTQNHYWFQFSWSPAAFGPLHLIIGEMNAQSDPSVTPVVNYTIPGGSFGSYTFDPPKANQQYVAQIINGLSWVSNDVSGVQSPSLTCNPTIGVSITNGPITVAPGNTANFNVHVTSSNFQGNVNLTQTLTGQDTLSVGLAGSVAVPLNGSVDTPLTASGPTPGTYNFGVTGSKVDPWGGSSTSTANSSLTVASPNFSVSVGAQTPNPVTAGGSATYIVTVTSSGGFNSPVTLTNNLTGTGIGSSFAPSVVTPPANGSATSTLTVTTTGATPAGTYNTGTSNFQVFGNASGFPQKTATSSLVVIVPAVPGAPTGLNLTNVPLCGTYGGAYGGNGNSFNFNWSASSGTVSWYEVRISDKVDDLSGNYYGTDGWAATVQSGTHFYAITKNNANYPVNPTSALVNPGVPGTSTTLSTARVINQYLYASVGTNNPNAPITFPGAGVFFHPDVNYYFKVRAWNSTGSTTPNAYNAADWVKGNWSGIAGPAGAGVTYNVPFNVRSCSFDPVLNTPTPGTWNSGTGTCTTGGPSSFFINTEACYVTTVTENGDAQPIAGAVTNFFGAWYGGAADPAVSNPGLLPCIGSNTGVSSSSPLGVVPTNTSQSIAQDLPVNYVGGGATATFTFHFNVGAVAGTQQLYIYVLSDCTKIHNNAWTVANNSKSLTYSITAPNWFESVGGDVGVGPNANIQVTTSSSGCPAGRFQSDYLLFAGASGANSGFAHANPAPGSLCGTQEGWKSTSYSQNLVPPAASAGLGSAYNYLYDRFFNGAAAGGCNVDRNGESYSITPSIYTCSPVGNVHDLCASDLGAQSDNILGSNCVLNSAAGTHVVFVNGPMWVSGNIFYTSGDRHPIIYVIAGDLVIDSNVSYMDGIFIVGGTTYDYDKCGNNNFNRILGENDGCDFGLSLAQRPKVGPQLCVDGGLYTAAFDLQRTIGQFPYPALNAANKPLPANFVPQNFSCNGTLPDLNAFVTPSLKVVYDAANVDYLTSVIGSPQVNWQEIAP